MPRETIGYDGNRTVVKWRKDDENPEFPNTPGEVQIAVLNPGIEDPDETGAAGFYADLDGDQINYLISVLRKAKRQAFPADHQTFDLVVDSERAPVAVVDVSAFRPVRGLRGNRL